MTVVLGSKAIHIGWVPATGIVLFLIATTWQLAVFIGGLKQDLHEIKVSQVELARKDTLQDRQILKSVQDIKDTQDTLQKLKFTVHYVTEVRTRFGIKFNPYRK